MGTFAQTDRAHICPLLSLFVAAAGKVSARPTQRAQVQLSPPFFCSPSQGRSGHVSGLSRDLAILTFPVRIANLALGRLNTPPQLSSGLDMRQVPVLEHGQSGVSDVARSLSLHVGVPR